MEANRASYCDFLCQPVAQNDDYNADTEPQTQEDKYNYILTELQKYLTCLEQGAWGDYAGYAQCDYQCTV